RQRELRLLGGFAQHAQRDVLTERRAVLEAMPRSAADEPDVRRLRMPVDDEVRIRSLLVLAHARLDEGRLREAREAPREIGPRGGRARVAQPALTIGGIEGRAAAVVRDLEAAILVARNAVPQ